MNPITLMRLTTAGVFDSAFSNVTASVLDTVNSVASLSDSRILIGGSSTASWLAIRRLRTNGVLDATFQVRNAPSVAFRYAEVRQLLVQPDGRILFSAALHTYSSNYSKGLPPDRALVGRLLPDGTWDASFALVDCALPLTQQPGPFWFNDPITFGLPVQPSYLEIFLRPVPAVLLARQPDGVLAFAGAFDSVNGEPRRRLARLEPDGLLRGRLRLNLIGHDPLRLLAPAEVETPYRIETSTDLNHWMPWLLNSYPWWPVELWLSADEPAQYFRARPTE